VVAAEQNFFLSGLGNQKEVVKVGSMGCSPKLQHSPLFSPDAGGKVALDDESPTSRTPEQTDDDTCSNVAEEASTGLPSINTPTEHREGTSHHHMSFEEDSTGFSGIDRIALGKTNVSLLKRAFTAPVPEHEKLLLNGWEHTTEPFGEASAVHDGALDGLHNLFDRYWDLIAAELGRSSVPQENNAMARLVGQTCVCLVQLPTGYQGLQCRRSTCDNDRHMRFVANRASVVGLIIEEGKWLQLSRTSFLPTSIGPIQVLQPQPHSECLVRRYQQQEETFQLLEHTRSMHSGRSLEFGIFSWCNCRAATADK